MIDVSIRVTINGKDKEADALYLLSDGEYVKVGISRAGWLRKRIINLRVGNPREMVLIACLEGCSQAPFIEAVFCHLAKAQSVRGSWFRLSAVEAEQVLNAALLICQDGQTEGCTMVSCSLLLLNRERDDEV